MAWNIDPTHTQIEFSVKHMMISTVRGRFGKFSGTLHIDDQDMTKSTAEGTIEVTTLDTNEPNRDGHLRSPDFFDVEKYPVMTFRSTSVTQTGEDKYKVTGDMTIKDVTRQVVFDVAYEGRMKDPWGNTRIGLTADTAINRKDYGLTWNVGLEAGGVLVADTVKIHAELEAVYQADAVAETGAVAAA